MGDSCFKAYLNISVQAVVLSRRERESRTKRSRVGGRKVLYIRLAQSIPIRTSELVKQWSGVRAIHPGFRHPSSRLKVNKSQGVEGQSLYLLKLVSKILMQTCCLSTSYKSESAFTKTMLKAWWGGLQFPTVTECQLSKLPSLVLQRVCEQMTFNKSSFC